MNYRQRLIRIFTFLGGIYFFLEFVLPASIGGLRLDTYHEQISDGFVAIGAMAVGLGIINLLMVHGSKIVFRRTGWFNSSALLLGLALMMVVSWQDWRATSGIAGDVDRIYLLRDFALRIALDQEKHIPEMPPVEFRRLRLTESAQELLSELRAENLGRLSTLATGVEANLSTVYERDYKTKLDFAETVLAEGQRGALVEIATGLGELGNARRELLNFNYGASKTKFAYSLLYDGLFVALGSAMFSLLGFYIAGAAYRAFRIRSAESALMMVAALLVMLGQIPFGLWLWDGLPEVRLWLLSTPSSAAFRAIKFGAAVAGLILAFRMWFSIESQSFAERRK